MAKKRASKKAPASGRLKNVLVLRGTDEWKAWLDGLAAANSAPLTVTIDQALKLLADKLGHGQPPRRQGT